MNMRFSVIVPAFNCEETIEATLRSVLRQTEPAFEILVMDDGSTDHTASILEKYRPRIRIFQQPNAGLGAARDALCLRAQGDIVAPIDSDDLWHPNYLEMQRKLIEAHPDAAAYFTGHLNFEGNRDYEWTDDLPRSPIITRVIESASFIKEYNRYPGPFASMSYCCVPATILRKLGGTPFRLRKSEDLYFFNRAALLGPIVYGDTPLVAYRVRLGSLSSNRLLLAESTVRTFDLLQEEQGAVGDRRLGKAFHRARANKRRFYAKALMGAGRIQEARWQMRRSCRDCIYLTSIAKSIALLLLTYMPAGLQPTWPRSGYDARVVSAS
jgi:glycosyltransferase involved in cell wall biosynthesis